MKLSKSNNGYSWEEAYKRHRLIGCAKEQNTIWYDIIHRRYGELYHLSSDKHIKVENAGNWENNKWEWKMKWSRNLTANECTSTSEMLQILSGFAPDSSAVDSLLWLHNPEEGFTVRLCFSELIFLQNEALADTFSKGD
ncbi:hypothetical protein L195_g011748 [Trifolium pratense]|uniref:Uncharacterized protein n=1 Tax=Trifolium pratense TaxID=57577 RepID=A0A2K3PIF8_TRIPR|nr:hypothetical protein L195_g011748 [Trifolium pratense]